MGDRHRGFGATVGVRCKRWRIWRRGDALDLVPGVRRAVRGTGVMVPFCPERVAVLRQRCLGLPCGIGGDSRVRPVSVAPLAGEYGVTG